MRVIDGKLNVSFQVLASAEPYPSLPREQRLVYDPTAIDRAYRLVQAARLQNLDIGHCALAMGLSAFWSVQAYFIARNDPMVRLDTTVMVATASHLHRVDGVPVYLDARAWPDTTVALLTGPDGTPFP